MSEHNEGPVRDCAVGELVRKLEDNYTSGSKTNISKYVEFDMYENINKIDAYLNSRHISGDTDSMGREKPFFDIVTAATNIWYRATDLDRKHIRVRPTREKDVLAAFLATVHIQAWMRRENFGAFLNDWGRTLAKYGSAVVKFVEKEGRLHSTVVPWNRLIVDPVDFDGNIKIEILELTEAQLRRRKGYDKEMVRRLCETKQARETLDGQDKDRNDDYIKLYEVHGEMPLSYLTGKEEDSEEYVQQMHVVSFVASKEKGKFDDFTLVSGREEKDPYMITHLIREDGRTMGIGAVEHLFEAQWMVNHSAKNIKDQLDLASKIVFQTSDPNFLGQNVTTSIENGEVLIHSINQPLTRLAGTPDIAAAQSFGQMWKALAQEITSTPDSLMGNNAPSGTAWRQVEALQSEAHSLFEVMTENKGFHLVDMFTTYVIPHVKKKFDTAEEITATLEDFDLARIDARFVKNKAAKATNEKLVEAVLNDGDPTEEDKMAMLGEESAKVQEMLSPLGNQRFFKPSDVPDRTWKEVLKDLEWELEVDVTDESQFSKEDLATLTTMFQTVMDPNRRMMLDDPRAKFLWNKILMKTNAVSPLELASQPSAPQTPAMPAMPPMGDPSLTPQSAEPIPPAA